VPSYVAFKLDDCQVETGGDPSDAEAHLCGIGRIVPPPLRKRGDSFEPLSRLRELEDRVVVIYLLGALNVRTDELEIAPHGLEDLGLIGHVPLLGVRIPFLF
jgi:hypothetical protein